MNLTKFFEAAYSSKWGLKKLNFILRKGIPFNNPHKLNIVSLEPGKVSLSIPYIRKNLNHLKGVHACCLATGAEYTSGVAMLSRLDATKYRLIMESMEVKYHYQAKMSCSIDYQLSEAECLKQIIEPLENTGVASYQCVVEVHDTEQNHICTGYINWQIKSWKQVRTAV